MRRVANPSRPTGKNGHAFVRCSIVLPFSVVGRTHLGNLGFSYTSWLQRKEKIKMPKANNKFLDTGDMFPRLEMSQIGGEKIVLPNDLLGKWGVVLFYSGHW